MFQVVYDNETYKVSFHRYVSSKNKTENPTMFDTVCKIKVTDGSAQWYYQGVAKQSREDRYNKWKGRKLAMTRALESCVLRKQCRATLWNKFLECKKGVGK